MQHSPHGPKPQWTQDKIIVLFKCFIFAFVHLSDDFIQTTVFPFSFFFLFLFNYQIVHLVICLNGTSYLLIFMRHMPLRGFSSSVNPNNIIDTLILYYIHVLFKTPVGSSVSWDTAHMWFCGLSPSERNSLLLFMERVIFFFFYDISVISLSVLECILCSFYLFF